MAFIGQSHFAILPGASRDTWQRPGAVSDGGAPSAAAPRRRTAEIVHRRRASTAPADGEPGLELRRIDGNQVLVTRVTSDGPADTRRSRP